MKFEDNELIKNVLEIKNEEQRNETLELLRKLDVEITPEIAKDILDIHGKITGSGFISTIGEKAKE